MQNNPNRLNVFEAIFNHASMGIVVVNSDGLIQSANPFALRLFGYAIDEILDKPIEILIPQRYHHKHTDHRQGYVHNPRNRPMGLGMDLFAVKHDGTEFPVEVSLSNYESGDEKEVIAFVSDITVRKKAEAEIEKLNNELEMTVEQRTKDLTETLQQLEVSRDQLGDVLSFQKALLDSAGAIIIATDEKGVIKLFNPEAASSTGYTDAEVIDKTTTLLFHDKEQIARKREELFDEFGITIQDDFSVLIEKSRRNIHEEEQYTYIRKDGTAFPVSLTITSIRDNDGRITGYVNIAIDVSEREKVEKNLRMTLEKEKELSELKTRFVSMASHEFRTPLSTVLSSAYLIEKYISGDEQPKREKHLNRIVSSVNMLTDILNDFLSVGKIEEGKIQVRLTRFNIQKWVMAVATEMENSLKAKQTILYEHSGDADVELDASLLKHIIMNLVSNASKFSPEATPIEMHTVNTGDRIVLTVKDHGIGISKEDQKHLMERFFRGANAGNIQGTGLGLHIVSKYAELMNGAVDCKSNLENGTEFAVTFNTKEH